VSVDLIEVIERYPARMRMAHRVRVQCSVCLAIYVRNAWFSDLPKAKACRSCSAKRRVREWNGKTRKANGRF
jgi:hypothetical protein